MARAGADILADADLLAPVPLHALRLWQRQFNQAAALTTEISRRTGKPCNLASLRRIKATRSQVGLSRQQRAENVQGAFRIAETAVVRDLNVVLVDDVLTSGATANAASRALLRAGAKRVDVLVFARVVTAA
jgi:ComF family protein